VLDLLLPLVSLFAQADGGLFGRGLGDSLVQLPACHGDFPDRCAILLADVDGFKAINDSRGHAAGDDVLRAVAGVLRAVAPAHGKAYRIGGDEFAILLPGSDGLAAAGTSRRLADWLERDGRSSILRPKASFGVAERTEELASADLLLRAADEAMYRAKHERKLGRTAAG